MARRKKNLSAREKFIISVSLVLIVAISGAFFVFDGVVDEFRIKLGLQVAPEKVNYINRYTYDLNDLNYSEPTGTLLDVHFVDMLQGDAVYVELPDGKNMLIDAGRHDKSATTTELIEYLSAEGVDSYGIDYLVLTHSDADHVGGMDEVLEAFSVRNVFLPPLIYDNTAPFEGGSIGTATFREFLDAVEAEPNVNVLHTTQENEDDLSWSGTDYSVNFYCAPADYFTGVTKDSSAEIKNNMSCVIFVEYAGRKVLLTGDLHDETEDDDFAWSESHLINRIGGSTYDVDVYKMGHHGSNSSSSAAFLSFFKPEVAIASVGDQNLSSGNTYNHPTPGALNRLVNANCNYLFRTDRHGNIVVSIGANGGLRFATEKDCRAIYA